MVKGFYIFVAKNTSQQTWSKCVNPIMGGQFVKNNHLENNNMSKDITRKPHFMVPQDHIV